MAVVFTAIAAVCFANPFASEVEVVGGAVVIDQSSPSNVTIQYRLNAPADRVIVLIENQTSDWNKRTLDSDIEVGVSKPGLDRGLNTVEWDGQRDGGGNAGDGFYDITITAQHYGFGDWTDITPNAGGTEIPAGDLVPSAYLYTAYGMECIYDQASPNFGTVLISNVAAQGSSYGQPKASDYDTKGIYILRSDFSLDGGTTTSARATGNDTAGFDNACPNYALPFKLKKGNNEDILFCASFDDSRMKVITGDELLSAASIHVPLNDSVASYWGPTNLLGCIGIGTGGSRMIIGPEEDMPLPGGGGGLYDVIGWNVGTTTDDYDSTPVLVVPNNITGTTQWTIRGIDAQTSGTFAYTNRRSASSLSEQAITCINGATKAVNWTYSPNDLGITTEYWADISFSPDETKVYALARYGNIHEFDAESGANLSNFVGSASGWGRCITVDAAGNVLYYTSSDEEMCMMSPPGGNAYITTAFAGSLSVTNSEVVDWAVFD